MNVYDFDGTIYNGDSSIDFFKFVIKKQPRVLKQLPEIIKAFFQYLFGIIDKKDFKGHYFSFLKYIDGTRYVHLFWEKHQVRINKWYLEQQRDNDVIISASPEFLLAPVCKKIGVKYLIASDVDIGTGTFKSSNCKGEEKVTRFKNQFPDEVIEEFYTDSKSDRPLAHLAEKAFVVRHGKIMNWKYGKER